MIKLILSLIIPIFTILFSLPVFAETKISVLPFDVLTEKSDMKQFGIGTMDTITNALNNVPEFIMIDRGQLNAVLKELAFQKSSFIDQNDTERIGKLIGADILVMGTIQAYENKYRINAHFTEVKTGKILKTIVVTGTDIFGLQDELASELIKQQNINVSTEQKQRISNITKATNSINAYDYYIKGRTQYLLSTQQGYEKAIELFDKAIENDNEYTLALAAKSEAQANLAIELNLIGLSNNDLLQKAEENAKKALAKNNNLSEIHRSLSNIYVAKMDFKNSIKEGEIALKLNPNDAETYALLWLSKALEKGKYDSKDPLILKSLKLNPHLVSSHSLLAMTYLSEFNLDKAILEANEVVRISPDYVYSYIILGSAYTFMDKYEESLNSYQKALSLSPKNTIARLGMVNIYLKQNNTDKAYVELNEIIKDFPQLSAAHYHLSNIFMLQKKYKQAEESMKEAVKLTPGFLKYEFTHYVFAMSYLEQGNLEEAKKSFKESLKIFPKYSLAVKGLNSLLLKQGIGLYQQGKYLESISYFNEMAAIDEKNIDVYINLGSAYYSIKNFDLSLKNYLKAIEIAPNHAGSHYNLGLVYSIINKTDLAKIEYKKACDLGMKDSCF